ncbi:phage tail assembly chaperone [Providencia sp. 21OH12SH02B-Prov]|uniref:phage tail assembly chaperone n=1 Tax=Providencia sp. 21OH12SH02B-Prov TaxID=3015951 RepID=UPI0022B6C397|nr:phage tail assembly chaperone [Providencia sp. 21OH12SH02B-Prov]WBA57886.1 phage tail assembly chaperone [Providencia sp. 21OH12SH02B-Prov]
MPKFTLIPEPRFKADVKIPVAGKEKPEIVTFTFNHMPMSKLEELKDEKVDDFFKKIIANWAIEEPYNEDNLNLLFDNYPAAAGAITTAYYHELLGNREKNS